LLKSTALVYVNQYTARDMRVVSSTNNGMLWFNMHF